jgi:hypothetical protein
LTAVEIVIDFGSLNCPQEWYEPLEPRPWEEVDMVILGLILLIIGLVASIPVLVTIGAILLIVGLILNFVPIGGTRRRFY